MGTRKKRGEGQEDNQATAGMSPVKQNAGSGDKVDLDCDDGDDFGGNGHGSPVRNDCEMAPEKVAETAEKRMKRKEEKRRRKEAKRLIREGRAAGIAT